MHLVLLPCHLAYLTSVGDVHKPPMQRTSRLSIRGGILAQHWTKSSSKRKRYGTIDEHSTNLRPIAFVIATNRTFNIDAFCKSLLLSIEGSRLQKKLRQEPLLHLYLACRSSQDILLPSIYQNLLALHSFQFDERRTHNIGLSRKKQVELAEVACLELNDPILIMLDDDLTFEALVIENGIPTKCYPFSYIHEVYLFARNYPCDVALGGVTGAPPLPATSSMRTFLQDFLAVQSKSKKTEKRWKDADYYYDLSETRSCWENWPALQLTNGPSSVQSALNQMFHSGPENRPLVYIPGEQKPQPRIVRGGNTVVFNPQYLYDIEHPPLPRRGDSIWSILAKEQGAIILEFPIPLHHTRTSEMSLASMQKRPFSSSLKSRMSNDLLGSSIQRAMLTEEEILPIYIGRINRQMYVVEECLELLQRAGEFDDDCSRKHGYWAMSVKERGSFVAIATELLNSLKMELKMKNDMALETTKESARLVKAMRHNNHNTKEETR